MAPWSGPLKTIVDLFGPDSPGAQAYNPNAVPTGPVFTYRQGGTAGAGIYTSFAAAFAAALAVSYLAPTIVIDASLGTPVITPGTYALPSTLTIQGLGLPTLTIQDGATFTSGTLAELIFCSLTVTVLSTTAATWTPAGTVILLLRNGATIQSQGGTTTKVFLSCASGAAGAFVDMGFDGTLAGTAAAAIVNASGGGSAQVTCGDFSTIANNSLTGNGITVILLDSSASLGTTQTGLVSPLVEQGPSNAKPALSLSAAGGAQTLPVRPTVLAAPTPSWFLATPSGNQAAATTYTLQVGGAYQPGDIVHIVFTKTQLNAANVTIVDGGAGTPTLTILLNASVGASGNAYAEVQLNAAGTHWIYLSGGYN